MIIDQIKRAYKWIGRGGRGILVAYALLCSMSYLVLWGYGEPLGIDDKFVHPPGFFSSRWFWHIMISIMLSAHMTIILYAVWAARIQVQSVQDQKTDKQPASPESSIIQKIDTTNESEETLKKLMEYESLENDILGLLADGRMIEINKLTTELGYDACDDDRRLIRLALAKLTEAGKIIAETPQYGLPGVKRTKMRDCD